MISQTAEYALRAAVWLASQDGSARTARQIAAGTQVPPGYLSKVMQSLAAAQLVTSQRGLGGGFQLARPARNITVLEVINAVDPVKRVERCPLGLQEHSVRLCKLHQRIDYAIAAVETAFSECTVAELIEKTAEPFAGAPGSGRAPASGNLAAKRGRRRK